MSTPATRPIRTDRLYAIRPGASGDITLAAGATSNDYIAWAHPTLGSYNPSALVYGDYHYTLLDRGILICHDARTGEEVYPRQRVSPGGSLFTASPWAYNGKIFAISEDGDTYVVKAGPEFELLGTNALRRPLPAPDDASRGTRLSTATSRWRPSLDRASGRDRRATFLFTHSPVAAERAVACDPIRLS